jgi:hypothetical protein
MLCVPLRRVRARESYEEFPYSARGAPALTRPHQVEPRQWRSPNYTDYGDESWLARRNVSG